MPRVGGLKTEIASGAWLNQRRWEIKWQCYSTIAEHLGEVALLLEQVNAIQRQAPGLDEETFAKRTAEKEAALAAALEKHRRYASIARIVVAPRKYGRSSASSLSSSTPPRPSTSKRTQHIRPG